MSTSCGFSVPPPPDVHYNNSESIGPSPITTGSPPYSTPKWTSRGGTPFLPPPSRTHGGIIVEPNPNLYIHNVPKDATEQELKKLFSSFGTVERIRLKVNQKIGPQALYAFVTFSSTSEAQIALQRLNGYDMRSRRLRVEFQRLRGDDDRSYHSSSHLDYSPRRSSHDTLKRRSSSWGSKTRDFPGREENRKRGYFSHGSKNNGYADQSNYNNEEVVDGGFSFKRARAYHSRRMPGGSRNSGYVYNGNEQFGTSETPVYNESLVSGEEPSSNAVWNTSSTNGPAANGTHRGNPYALSQRNSQGRNVRERVTIYLCELLRHLGLASLFEATDSASCAPKTYNTMPCTNTFTDMESVASQGPQSTSVEQPPSSSLDTSKDFHGNSSYETRTPSSTSFVTQHYSEPNRCGRIKSSHIWTGYLARNGRRKVPIKAFPISGAVEQFLAMETQLNISHRISWSELSKKNLCSVCYFELSDRELEADGSESYSHLTPQKKELYTKCFKDHIDYFTTKKKAGVVALAENKHLYIIPRGTFFFDQYSPGSLPEDVPVLMGVFTQTLPPQSYMASGRDMQGTFQTQTTEDTGSSSLNRNFSIESLQSNSRISQQQQQQQQRQQQPPSEQTESYIPQAVSSSDFSCITSSNATMFPVIRDRDLGAQPTAGEELSFGVHDSKQSAINLPPQCLTSSSTSYGPSTSSSQAVNSNPAIHSGTSQNQSTASSQTVTNPNGKTDPSPDMLINFLSSPRLLEALRATAKMQQSV